MILAIWGYTSTEDETTNIVHYDALIEANCEHIYSDTLSNRQQRRELLNRINNNDTLVVWCLCQFADSIADLHNLIEQVDARHITLITIKEKISHSSKDDKLGEMVEAMAKIEKDIVNGHQCHPDR